MASVFVRCKSKGLHLHWHAIEAVEEVWDTSVVAGIVAVAAVDEHKRVQGRWRTVHHRMSFFCSMETVHSTVDHNHHCKKKEQAD